MILLTRTVRFCINAAESGPRPPDRPDNTFAAYPSMRGLGRYYELTLTCRGDVSPETGYFLNIKSIDRAVRERLAPAIEAACTRRPETDPGAMLSELLDLALPALHSSVLSLRWRLTPYYSVEMENADRKTVLLRQQFEFAASHRLHAPSLSAEENRAVFGKCNNPSGHGHNYRVEPCVAVRLEPAAGGPCFTLRDLERLTNESVIERFDHKHLNIDTPEFACDSPDGLNPSVENIARVCFDRLAPVIAQAAGGRAVLRSITVWETDKTSCTYPA